MFCLFIEVFFPYNITVMPYTTDGYSDPSRGSRESAGDRTLPHGEAVEVS
jgi:hypothetical protein